MSTNPTGPLPPFTLDTRPRPIKDAGDGLVRWLGVGGSLTIALVGWGALTAAEGDAVVGLLGLVPGAVNAVATLITAISIRRRAEPRVTPMSDPRTDDGVRLVAAPHGR